MKYSGIGGQAVMEGVMMKNGDDYAVAVRKSNGEIIVKKDKFKGFAGNGVMKKIPVIRGVFAFVDSLVLGMSSLNFSSDIYMEEEDENKEGEKQEENKGKEKKKSVSDGIISTLITIIAVVFAVGLFMILPFYISQLFKKIVGNAVLLSLIEGVIRILIFIAYIKLISLMKDIKRVFMYHGAEHKCINCIESGMELNPENVRRSSREHRRCGTSFLLYVMVVSIIFFSFIQTPERWLRVVLRIVLVPVIAGVAYEFIRAAGRSSSPIIRALSAPGLWMQRLTTLEPDDGMIEVGIRSVEEVFDWRKYLTENFGLKFDKENGPAAGDEKESGEET
ncbi:MAG: DUF1385 domain-containing protein [Lachnospiraceae bacterium]|nr:DUF1385 domain-containing protein [Lachnospiraceae bacterium]